MLTLIQTDVQCQGAGSTGRDGRDGAGGQLLTDPLLGFS